MTINTLKLYIEPASLPLTYQLADYVKSIENPEIYSIIVFQRLKLNISGIDNGRTVFIDNVNNGLELKLDKISKFIISKSLTRLEIHTNIYRENDILFPLLQRIAPYMPLEKIQLHLYDDGVYTLQERASLGSLDEKKLALIVQKRKEQLLAILLKKQPSTGFEWNVIDNYIWHYFMDVKYYFLKPDVLLKHPNSYFQKMSRHVEAMSFTHEEYLPEHLINIWERLFNIPPGIQIRLRELSRNNNSVLFLTGYCVDKEKISVHHQALLEKIYQLKESSILPASESIIYKGHPENKALNDEIAQALGENITIIPENLPVEYLYISRLLPKKICGAFGTALFCMPDKKIKFVFMNGGPGNINNLNLLTLIRDYQCFDLEKIIYLDENNLSQTHKLSQGNIP